MEAVACSLNNPLCNQSAAYFLEANLQKMPMRQLKISKTRLKTSNSPLRNLDCFNRRLFLTRRQIACSTPKRRLGRDRRTHQSQKLHSLFLAQQGLCQAEIRSIRRHLNWDLMIRKIKTSPSQVSLMLLSQNLLEQLRLPVVLLSKNYRQQCLLKRQNPKIKRPQAWVSNPIQPTKDRSSNLEDNLRLRTYPRSRRRSRKWVWNQSLPRPTRVSIKTHQTRDFRSEDLPKLRIQHHPFSRKRKRSNKHQLNSAFKTNPSQYLSPHQARIKRKILLLTLSSQADLCSKKRQRHSQLQASKMHQWSSQSPNPQPKRSLPLHSRAWWKSPRPKSNLSMLSPSVKPSSCL